MDPKERLKRLTNRKDIDKDIIDRFIAENLEQTIFKMGYNYDLLINNYDSVKTAELIKSYLKVRGILIDQEEMIVDDCNERLFEIAMKFGYKVLSQRDIMTLKNEYLLTHGINSNIIIKTGDVVKIDWINETITK